MSEVISSLLKRQNDYETACVFARLDFLRKFTFWRQENVRIPTLVPNIGVPVPDNQEVVFPCPFARNSTFNFHSLISGIQEFPEPSADPN